MSDFKDSTMICHNFLLEYVANFSWGRVLQAAAQVYDIQAVKTLPKSYMGVCQ